MKRPNVVLTGVALLAASAATACTGFYVGKDASVDGTVLIGRTVDEPPWTASHRLQITPRVENAAGRVYRSVKTKFEWKLPATTWRMVSTPRLLTYNRGQRDSVCLNEKGFAISGTVTAHVRGSFLEADPMNKASGPGEDSLPGLLALSCANCREALDLVERIIAECGHDGGEIYMMADRDEAWMVEVYTGHQWAAVKMPPDKVTAFGNQFNIGSFDPASPDTRCSKDLVALPERLGKLVKGADGLPDLVATYCYERNHYANFRTCFAHECLAAEKFGEAADTRRVPTFYKPAHKVRIDEIFDLSRSRYEGTPRNPETSGDRKIRTIGTTKQATCHVIQLDPRLPEPYAATAWVTLANAEHTPCVPVNAAVRAVDPNWERNQAEGPYRFDMNIAGHAFRRLAALAEQDRRWYGKGVQNYWQARERKLVEEYAPLVKSCAEAGDPAGTSRLTAFCCREQARAYHDALRIFDDLMWYVMANNRIPGDGSGATDEPSAPFSVK